MRCYHRESDTSPVSYSFNASELNSTLNYERTVRACVCTVSYMMCGGWEKVMSEWLGMSPLATVFQIVSHSYFSKIFLFFQTHHKSHDQPIAKFVCKSGVSTSRRQLLLIFITEYVEFNYFALKCQDLDLNRSKTLLCTYKHFAAEKVV